MNTTDEDFPSWRQNFSAKPARVPVVLAFTLSVIGLTAPLSLLVAVLLSVELHILLTMASLYIFAISLAVMAWSIVAVFAPALSCDPATVSTQDGSTDVVVSTRLGWWLGGLGIFTAGSMLMLIASMVLFLWDGKKDGSDVTFGYVWMVGTPLVLCLLYPLVSWPMGRLTIGADSISYRATHRWFRSRRISLSIPWAAVSGMSADFHPEGKTLTSPMMRITLHDDAVPTSFGKLSDLLSRNNGGPLRLRLLQTGVNANVVYTLCQEYWEASAERRCPTENEVREMLRVPSLREQLRLSAPA